MTSKTSKDSAPLRKERERSLFKRLVISYFDLDEARQFLFKLTGQDGETPPKPDDKQCRKALRTALVVAYARPFSGNRGQDGTRDTFPDRLLKGLTKQQRNVHSRMLKLRNEEFAHSDAVSAGVKISVGRWPDGRPFPIPISRVTRGELAQDDLRVLDNLLEHLHRVIRDEMMRIERECSPGESF